MGAAEPEEAAVDRAEGDARDDARGDARGDAADEAEECFKYPWHLKLLGLALGAYVLMRLVEMVGWIVRWIGGD